jgi:hypothetical protein
MTLTPPPGGGGGFRLPLHDNDSQTLSRVNSIMNFLLYREIRIRSPHDTLEKLPFLFLTPPFFFFLLSFPVTYPHFRHLNQQQSIYHLPEPCFLFFPRMSELRAPFQDSGSKVGTETNFLFGNFRDCHLVCLPMSLSTVILIIYSFLSFFILFLFGSSTYLKGSHACVVLF